MYNETGFSLQNFIIKVILVVLFVFLLIWLFPMPKIPDLTPVYDRLFAENIETMGDAARSYYTVDRLPKEVNESSKLTLSEMISMKMVLPIVDSKGNSCDTHASFVEVQKTETEYLIKTSLTCSDRTDYVIEHFGCYDICSEKCASTEKTESTKKTTTKKTTTQKTVIVKPIVVPPVIVPPVIVPPVIKPPVTPPEKTKVTEILYGKDKVVEYTDWLSEKMTTGSETKNGVTTKVQLVDTNEYEEDTYKTKTKTLYSSMWAPESYLENLTTTTYLNYAYDPINNPRILDLDEIGVSRAAQKLSRSKLNLKLVSYGGLSSTDYSKYLKTREEQLRLEDGCDKNCSYPTASEMKEHSLKYNTHFTISDIDIEWNGSDYEINTVARIRTAARNVQGYYDSAIKGYIVYIPHKFTISWREPDYDTYYEYRYKKTTTYTDVWVVKGSSEEAKLIKAGYKAKDTKVYYK